MSKKEKGFRKIKYTKRQFSNKRKCQKMKAVKATGLYLMQKKEQRVGTQYSFKAFSFLLVSKTQQRKLFFVAIVEVRADKAGV